MLRREAASWLARLQGGRDPDVERKFRRWYESDPANAEAFDRVHRSYEQAGLLRHSAAAPVPWQGRPKAHPPSRRYALAAAVALVVLVPSCLLLVAGTAVPFSATHAMLLTTGVGEIRQVSLGDGSRLTLDTATSIEVEVGRSHRRALLKHGRARLRIATAREPFVVESGSLTARSGGAVLDVRRDGPKSRVDILAGRVEVRTSAGHGAVMSAAAGEAVIAESPGRQRKVAVPRGMNWPSGMLQFDGTPLGAAVDLANRYSNRRIIVQGDLRQLRVTGAFRAGDTAKLARALAEAFELSLTERADGNFTLSRNSLSRRAKKNGG